MTNKKGNLRTKKIREYIKLEIELKTLLQNEDDDSSDEADELRQKITDIYNQMEPNTELPFARIIGSDLNTLERDELFESELFPESAKNILTEQSIAELKTGENYLALLKGLKKGMPGFLNTITLAQLRAECYQKLGFPEVSKMFLDFVEKQNTQSCPILD